MKFNIALLHYTCPPVVGGVEEIVRQQALVFNRYYHNVKVFVGSGNRFSETCEVEVNPLLGSRNRQILTAQKLCREGNLERMQSLSERIYRYLVKSLRGFDVLIAHNVLTMPFNLPLTAALQRMGQDGLIPVLSWNHDSPYFYPNYPEYLDLFPWNILKKAESGMHYVVISESREVMFRRLYDTQQRISVVANGIDPIDFFHLDPGTVRLIQEQRLFEAEFLMVQPSRLHPRKNMELSIYVTKALHDLGVKARLLISGAHDPHGPRSVKYYHELKSLSRELGVEDDVLVMAEYTFESGEKLSMDRITMRDLYLIADILFLPSLQEGFGIPLLEAGMIKLPVVCSNIASFLEVGGNEVCVFDLNDRPEEIAKRILDFVAELKPHRMFRKVIRNFSWDNVYHAKLLPLLTMMVGSRRSPLV